MENFCKTKIFTSVALSDEKKNRGHGSVIPSFVTMLERDPLLLIEKSSPTKTKQNKKHSPENTTTPTTNKTAVR